MSRKPIMAAVSIIVVVGVIIGVVAIPDFIRNVKYKISPQTKAVIGFCSYTHYQESCLKILGPVNSTDPKQFIAKTILAAEEAVKKSENYIDSLIVRAKNNALTKMALDDYVLGYITGNVITSISLVIIFPGNLTFPMVILHSVNQTHPKDTMNYALDSLQASCTDISGSELRNISDDHVNDFRTWLSAVISYQQSCLDGFEHDSKMKEALQEGITDASELSRLVTKKLKPNAVVAKDGSGQFKTIGAALAAAPKKSNVRHVIYIKAAREKLSSRVARPSKMVAELPLGGLPLFVTAIGNGFIAKSMGFQNNAGPEQHQAVAPRVQSDKSAVFNCRIDGYQDTLHNQANRQFFRNCVISGTVDFIFGDSPTVIQNSLIIVRRPMINQFNTVTAQGRDFIDENTGTVIQNCRIVPEQKLFPDGHKFPTYLGRPWGKFSTTVIMESTLGDLIKRKGWIPFAGPDGVNSLNTLYYAEYNNRGPGANLTARVN
ncbi:putative Peptide chain release factor [Hibiscus syriacus]|uniref:Pectinesterase n=1 Tax=Hibiscus syriacus TaxID=106335 RepID=A0A6A2YGL6_HIBSY|nr:putative Peptide chain release factor [Hibiscus syriacus]